MIRNVGYHGLARQNRPSTGESSKVLIATVPKLFLAIESFERACTLSCDRSGQYGDLSVSSWLKKKLHDILSHLMNT